MAIAREGARAHVAHVAADRVDRRLVEVGVALDEAGTRPAPEPEEVVPDEHLPVGAAAGADADRGDPEALGDRGCDLGGDALQDERERSGFLHLDGLLDEAERRVGRAPLRTEAAEGGRALRRETEVAHDGDTRADDGAEVGCKGGSVCHCAVPMEKQHSMTPAPSSVQGLNVFGKMGAGGLAGKRRGKKQAGIFWIPACGSTGAG